MGYSSNLITPFSIRTRYCDLEREINLPGAREQKWRRKNLIKSTRETRETRIFRVAKNEYLYLPGEKTEKRNDFNQRDQGDEGDFKNRQSLWIN
jgi:hypothetical protein